MVVLRTRFLAPKDAVRCRSKPERKKVFPEGLETFAGSLGLAGCLAFHNGDNLVFLVAKLENQKYQNQNTSTPWLMRVRFMEISLS